MTIHVTYDAQGRLNAFYDSALHYPGGIPADAVAITAAEYASLLAGQAGGQSMVKGASGAPILAVPSLAQVQAAQIGILRTTAQKMILGGYISMALGQPHSYPSTATDQTNMQASVIASLLPGVPSGWTTPFWCADSVGIWAMRNHSAAQIQQAGSDGKAMIEAAQLKLAALKAQVQAATTAGAVQAVVW